MSALQWIHSTLRWFLLVLLVLNISRHFLEKDKPYSTQDKKWSLRLLIVTHINLVIGLIQYFFGGKGFAYFSSNSMGDIMKNAAMRFWAVEHIAGMLIGVTFITIANSLVKKFTVTHDSKHSKVLLFFTLALIIIIASIPWPFREVGKIENIPFIRGLQ